MIKVNRVSCLKTFASLRFDAYCFIFLVFSVPTVRSIINPFSDQSILSVESIPVPESPGGEFKRTHRITTSSK